MNEQATAAEAWGSRRRRRRAAGLLLPDVLVGLAMAGVLLLVLALAAGQYRQGSKALAQRRAAQNAAETALLGLRAGKNLGLGIGDLGFSRGASGGGGEAIAARVSRLHDAAPVDGQVWVEVQATCGQRTATLVGLAPAKAVEGLP